MIKNINQLAETQRNASERMAAHLASFAGTMTFVYIHSVWFIAWFILKLDINLLTLIVSLEAIFLSTFVMINQNLQDKKNRIELDHDYEVNRKAEEDIAALHLKVDKLLDK